MPRSVSHGTLALSMCLGWTILSFENWIRETGGTMFGHKYQAASVALHFRVDSRQPSLGFDPMQEGAFIKRGSLIKVSAYVTCYLITTAISAGRERANKTDKQILLIANQVTHHPSNAPPE